MTITAWTGDLGAIDNTFGYNDYLITATGNDALPTNIVDDLTTDGMRAAISGGANASSHGDAFLTDAEAEALARPGDALFRLPNGGILLRRSVFAERCTSASRPNNSLEISESMARALAFFGSTLHGSDPSGDLWCRRSVPGTTGSIETPWEVTDPATLRNIETILARIDDVRAGGMPDDIQPSQEALARELAAALTDTEIASLHEDLSSRLEVSENALDAFMRRPWYEQIFDVAPVAVGFAIFTGMAHYGWYLLAGGRNPMEGSRVLGGLRDLATSIRDFFRRPPDDPSGGAAGNGGGTGTEVSSSTSSSSAARVAVEEESSSFGVNWNAVGLGAATIGLGVVTAALLICPFDGPVGEVAAGTATVAVGAAFLASIGLSDATETTTVTTI